MKHLRILLVSLGLFLWGCSLKTGPSLDPESRLFLSQVQYIITPKEKKEFLSLKTPQERKKFIEEFWRSRDPDPSTPVNEFKEAYMQRLRMADRLFREGGRRGWETDRGMVYILLGPPSERYTQPVSNDPRYKGYEIWVYESRGFRVVFVDRTGTGHYEILWEQCSAAFIDALNSASEALKNFGRVGVFDFTLKPVIRNGKLYLQLKIPPKKLSYTKENGKFNAQVEVKVSGQVGGRKVNIKKEFKVELSNGKLPPIYLQIPLTSGKYDLKVSLKDMVGGAVSIKKVKFSLKRRNK